MVSIRAQVAYKDSIAQKLARERHRKIVAKRLLSKEKPLDYWDNIKNQRQIFNIIGRKMSVKVLEDWYTIQQVDVAPLGLNVLTRYDFSLHKALRNIYPVYKWHGWKFVTVPRHFWELADNQMDKINVLARNLRVKTLEDWYKVTNSLMLSNGGGSLLAMYKFSILRMLSSIFPFYNWKPWRFKGVPNGTWEEHDNIRMKLNDMGENLNVKQIDDWHDISTQDFKKQGFSMLGIFNGSQSALLRTAYPQHTWVFRKTNGFWNVQDNQLAFLDTVKRDLGITHASEWERVSLKQLKLRGGYHLSNNFFDLMAVISPGRKWDW
eukprot:CAMPEP_0168524058 /NCGR_PEP_ID=MMETSP0405-20121227/10405_1 /TAXON_ID=498012 /ORGANISM="Trichosphaerium sp, Strain Am-I-7 wt" /LENGTH=320 /DNA_ID=CAMNT_0008546155 /DNA_START=66 /DNA_END=1025 /DNA_ORIENTATION=-